MKKKFIKYLSHVLAFTIVVSAGELSTELDNNKDRTSKIYSPFPNRDASDAFQSLFFKLQDFKKAISVLYKDPSSVHESFKKYMEEDLTLENIDKFAKTLLSCHDLELEPFPLLNIALLLRPIWLSSYR